MIGEPKIFEIARKLLEKSTKDQVVWKNFRSDKTDLDCYFVQFPKSSFNVTYLSPETEPDLVTMWIENEDRKVAEVVVNENDQDPQWKLARDLYEEADRCVTGWDMTLSDIEKELQKERLVGI